MKDNCIYPDCNSITLPTKNYCYAHIHGGTGLPTYIKIKKIKNEKDKNS